MFVQTFIVPNYLNPVSSPADPAPDRGPATSLHVAHETWNDAFDLWLSSRRAQNTRRAYRSAWKHFLEFTRVQPWKVTSTDVAGWIESQHAEGLSAATILQRLAEVSSFYTYATRTYTLLGSDGREQPLHHFNPVNPVPRPKVNPYAKAKYLNVDQT